MAIPKKGTRKIIVQGITYRWLIRRKATYMQSDYGVGRLHVAIEHAENPGTTLLIVTDRGHPRDWGTKEIVPVTPQDISNWIIEALELNWQPEEKGSPFSVIIENGEMRMNIGIPKRFRRE